MPCVLAMSQTFRRLKDHHLDLKALHLIARLEASEASEEQAALSASAHPLHAQLLLIPQCLEAEDRS